MNPCLASPRLLLHLSATSLTRLWPETQRHWVRIPAVSDVCFEVPFYVIRAWLFCHAKPKGSICLVYKSADTAFWICIAVFLCRLQPRCDYCSVKYWWITNKTRCIEPVLGLCWSTVYDIGTALAQNWFYDLCCWRWHAASPIPVNVVHWLCVGSTLAQPT